MKLVRRLDQQPVTPRWANGAASLRHRVPDPPPAGARPARGRESVAERAADVLTMTLRPHVTGSLRRGGSPGSALLLDLAFLVPLDAEAAFTAAAAELAEPFAADGLAVEVSGPWAPYSFVSLGDGDA